MKKEIEDLIEIYENREKYQEAADNALKAEPLPRLAEGLNILNNISFGKNRQRAELLKLNENFLKELSGIKNRLGDKFFRLMEEEIPEAAIGDPALFFHAADDIMLKSDFAEPKVILSHTFVFEREDFPSSVFYLPGTLIGTNDWPESTVEEEDPYFAGDPLEWVIVPDYELTHNIKLDDPKFKFQCKKQVFTNYQNKWNEFLTKWHISGNWNGDLENLHVHSLPSVIVESDRKNHNTPVIIHVGVSATEDDLRRAWPQVEEIMKEARVFRVREPKDKPFLRDLIWYRLNKEESLSPSKIARDWAKRCRREIDLELIEKLIKHEPEFEKETPEGLLEEVNSDSSAGMAELRGRFLEARKAFVQTGLKDQVKKSIKNTEKKIMRLSSEEWDRNRARLLFERAVAPKDAEKILRERYPKDYPPEGEK